MTHNINGKVTYIQLGTGFWAIIGNDGKEWRPVNMPEQLKVEGKEVNVKAKEIEEEMSIFMWGTPVKIIRFNT